MNVVFVARQANAFVKQSGHENYEHESHKMNLLDISSTSPHYVCRE